MEVTIEKPLNGTITQQLKVVHRPQLGSKVTFEVKVKSLREAHLVSEVMAQQHLTLFKGNIIPDYANMIGVEVLNEEGEWEDYISEDGWTFDEYVEFQRAKGNDNFNAI